MIKSDKEEIFVYVHFAGVVDAKVLFARIEEKTGDGKTETVSTQNPFQEFSSKWEQKQWTVAEGDVESWDAWHVESSLPFFLSVKD